MERSLAIMKSIIVFIFFLLISTINAQVTQEWVIRYNGPGNGIDNAYSMAVDGLGNVYVTGSSYGGSGNTDDYATIKFNSAGVQQWVVRYNGTGDYWDEAYSIAVDGSGNVYVAGRSWGGVYSEYNYATIKYNSAGVQQWVKKYVGLEPSNHEDWARSIAVWAGNVYVTGRSRGSKTNYDFVTIKYNSAGDEVWVQSYNGPGNGFDDATSIAVDGSGNVYVTGGSEGSGTGLDYATIKYNSAGVQEWVRRYNGPGNDYDRANFMAVDGTGNVYVTGESFGSGTGYDYATIKYNSAGVQQWVPRYNGPGNNFDQALSLAVDGSGNVFVTGASQGSGTSRDYATVKYSSLGFQQWASRYNGPGNSDDNATSIAMDGLGYVYVTGSSYGGSGTSLDYATIKYNSAGGIQQWLQRYNGPGNGDDRANSLAVDGSGNVHITGSSYGGSSIMDDYATIKYSQPPTGVYLESSNLPENFSLSQNYPNPFNPLTTIRYEIPQTSFVTVRVYDILGRAVEVLVNEEKPAGKYEVEFDASRLSSGVYIYKIQAEEYVNVRKMILLR